MSFFWSRFLSVSGEKPISPPMFFSCLPTLETDDLVLRRPRLKDAKDVFSYASDKEVARYVLWTPHRSIAETRSCLRELIHRARRGYPSSWAVVHRGTGRVIGTIGFVWYSHENHSAEIGYSLSREYWNRGYATQAVRAVISRAFSDLPLNRIEAQHDLRNPASGKVLEKSGFRKEGILRSRIVNKGEYIDVALYAILKEDMNTVSLSDQR